MKNPAWLPLAAVGILSLTAVTQNAWAGAPCVRKEFKTVEIKVACAQDQKAAKDIMKKFMKQARFKDCKSCHTSLSPDYRLAPDGLKKYQEAGGK